MQRLPHELVHEILYLAIWRYRTVRCYVNLLMGVCKQWARILWEMFGEVAILKRSTSLAKGGDYSRFAENLNLSFRKLSITVESIPLMYFRAFTGLTMLRVVDTLSPYSCKYFKCPEKELDFSHLSSLKCLQLVLRHHVIPFTLPSTLTTLSYLGDANMLAKTLARCSLPRLERLEWATLPAANSTCVISSATVTSLHLQTTKLHWRFSLPSLQSLTSVAALPSEKYLAVCKSVTALSMRLEIGLMEDRSRFANIRSMQIIFPTDGAFLASWMRTYSALTHLDCARAAADIQLIKECLINLRVLRAENPTGIIGQQRAWSGDKYEIYKLAAWCNTLQSCRLADLPWWMYFKTHRVGRRALRKCSGDLYLGEKQGKTEEKEE